MPTYKNALADLSSLPLIRDGANLAELSGVLVQACDRAVAWKPAADPYDGQRREDRIFLEKGLPSMAKAVAKLQGIADKHARCFDLVVWRSIKATGITPDMLRAAGYDSGSGGQGGRFVRSLLACLRDDLKSEACPGTRRAVKGKDTGGIQRYVRGPLRYPDVVDGTRMPDPRITGLQFELVFHLRRYTAGRKMREIRIGDTLPKYGSPHHDIVAAFTRAAINHIPLDNGEAFTKAMRSNTSAGGTPVCWWGWGAPEGHKASDDVFSHWQTDD